MKFTVVCSVSLNDINANLRYTRATPTYRYDMGNFNDLFYFTQPLPIGVSFELGLEVTQIKFQWCRSQLGSQAVGAEAQRYGHSTCVQKGRGSLYGNGGK